MGRACVCCGDQCINDRIYLFSDRYKANTISVFTETQEFYELIYKREDGPQSADPKKLGDQTIVTSGTDDSLFVVNTYRINNESSEEFYSGGEIYVKLIQKKTTIIRRLAIEFNVHDVFDWDKDFIEDISLRLGYYNSNNFDGHRDWEADSDYVKISGILKDKPLPTSLSMFNSYVRQSDTIKEINNDFELNVVDLADLLPKENSKFLFLLEPAGVETKDEFLDEVDEDVTGSAVQIGKWTRSNEIEDVIWLELYRRNNIPSGLFLDNGFDNWTRQFATNIQYDWHDCFYRPAEGEYISTCKYMDTQLDFTNFLNIDYFKRGGKLEVEIFKEKTDNTKAGARQSYFNETFELVYSDGAISFTELASYQQIYDCEDPDDFTTCIPRCGPGKTLKLVERSFLNDSDCISIITRPPSTIDPLDRPPDGGYIWEYRPIEADGCVYSPKRTWLFKYGDYTMYELSSSFTDSDRDGLNVGSLAFNEFLNSFSVSQEWGELDYFYIRDCVIESPSAWTTEESLYQEGDLKSYYRNVPHFGSFEPANIRLKIIDFSYYPGTLSINEVFNDRTGNNAGCPDISCVGGPSVLEWRVFSESFPSVGGSVGHSVIYNGGFLDGEGGYLPAGCETVIIPNPRYQTDGGKVELAYSEGINWAIYDPSVAIIYDSPAILDSLDLYGEEGRNYDPSQDPGFYGGPFGTAAPFTTPVQCSVYTFGKFRTNCGGASDGDIFGGNWGTFGSGQSCSDPPFNIVRYDGFGFSGIWGIGTSKSGFYSLPFGTITSYGVGIAVPQRAGLVPQGRGTQSWAFSDVITLEGYDVEDEFSSKHTIRVEIEPFLQGDDFSVFNSSSDGPTRDLILGVADIFDKDFNTYIFEISNYTPGSGIRFRIQDSFFDCSNAQSAYSDFDILYQQWVPVIVQDGQLSQDEIDEIAGYITDFDYWYQIKGEVFVESEDGKEIKEVDGNIVLGDTFENAYFYIDGSGSVSEPQNSLGFVPRPPDFAVYDDVELTFGGVEWSGDCDQDEVVTGAGSSSRRQVRSEVFKELEPSFPGNFYSDECISRTIHRRKFKAQPNGPPPDCDPFEDSQSVETWGGEGWFTAPGEIVTFPVEITVPEGHSYRFFPECDINTIFPPSDPECYSRIEILGRLADDNIDEPFTLNLTGSVLTEPSGEFDNRWIKSDEGSSSTGRITTLEGFDYRTTSATLQYKKTVPRFSCGDLPILDFGADDLLYRCSSVYDCFFHAERVDFEKIEYKYGLDIETQADAISEIDGIISGLYDPFVYMGVAAPEDITLAPLGGVELPTFQSDNYGTVDFSAAREVSGINLGQHIWEYYSGDTALCNYSANLGEGNNGICCVSTYDHSTCVPSEVDIVKLLPPDPIEELKCGVSNTTIGCGKYSGGRLISNTYRTNQTNKKLDFEDYTFTIGKRQ
jgi:hypothetical protein